MRKGNLQPAHKGYRYQDIATAYMLIRCLVEGFDEVTVDKKQVDGDVIDDLEIKVKGQRIRRQFKSSDNPSRSLSVSDFKNPSSVLPINQLLLTYTRDQGESISELRLCATWSPPESNDAIYEHLQLVDVPPTFYKSVTTCYKLNPHSLWPENSSPLWSVLSVPHAEYSRADFIVFCEKFIIEVGLPLASYDLSVPNEIEREILELLSDRVGIGRYPNQGRQSADVAALAISLANLARTNEGTLVPSDIKKNLEIQTDFGRIAQSFPFDEKSFYDRPGFRNSLKQRIIKKSGVYLITAEPGAGKSWELTRLASELQQESVIVARHYCYLEPGDELTERRVTTDVFFGNLLAELDDACKEIASIQASSYSTGINELEDFLSKISLLDKHVVLIIDGIDHIARVRSASSILSDNETDIVEQLATLKYPPNVSVVIGSQSGEHLNPLRDRPEKDLSEYNLPKWTSPELTGLAKKHAVHEALTHIMDTEQCDDFLSELSKSADGNPLYARYISISVIEGLKNGNITNPNEWLSSYPPINGDIANYYKHLYESASEQAQVIADLLGIIDFSVTQNELTNIAPLVRAWIPKALSKLNPILTEVSSQGGVRIFHESFRRFMLDELERQDRSLQDILKPVIKWLDALGFYESAKSYRFLLPALRRAERFEEIFQHVSARFISESLAHVHSTDAIHKNLVLVADIAGSMQNWPILVRCNELRRALHTYIQERDDNDDSIFEEYWRTSIVLFGADELAKRLLFDGHPILPRMKGLTVCSMIDDAGGVAPWREYFALSYEKGRVSRSETLALIHGHLRLGHYWRIARPIYSDLFSDDVDFLFVRRLAARLSEMIAPEFVEKIAGRVNRNVKRKLPINSSIALRLGVADFYREKNNIDQQKLFANKASVIASKPTVVLECIKLGALVKNIQKIQCSPSEIDIAVEEKSYLDEGSASAWLQAIRYTTIFDDKNQLLEIERERVKGAGWYRCWLEYAIAIAEAEADSYRGKTYNLGQVFNLLLKDTHPFTGEPRACDLYRAEGAIRESFELGLSLLKTEAEWKMALSVLAKVCNETRSHIHREDGGPFRIGTFLEILMPYACQPLCQQQVQEILSQQICLLDDIGSYYSTHAEYTMKLVRAQAISGNRQAAFGNWKKAVTFLTGYGFRKDITLFDIVESVPTLLNVSQKAALDSLDKLQPLVRAVVSHTDGRSTKHIPNMWFDSLLHAHPVAGVELLFRTILEDRGIENWATLQALKNVLKTVSKSANPMITDALWQTLIIDIEHENSADEELANRLVPIERLSDKHPELAEKRLSRLATEVSNDVKRHRKEGLEAFVQSVAASSFSMPTNFIHKAIKKKKKGVTYKSKNIGKSLIAGVRYPVFPPSPSLLEILSSIRKADKDLATEDSKECIALPLAYILSEMSDNNQEELAFKILYFFIRESKSWWSPEPIHQLAQSFDNGGHQRLAAVTYALAFTYAKGGGGWHDLGDEKHSHMINKALCINPDLALETVSKEVAYKLRHIEYGAGISQSLIERLTEWGKSELAYQAWKEAFDVISLRLLLPPESGWFAELNLCELPRWSIDEALVSLLLVRISEPRLTRKMDALDGLARIIKYYPETVGKPLAWWLSRDTYVSSILLVLDLLFSLEAPPYPVTRSIEEQLYLYAQCSSWGINKLSRRLLERSNLDVPRKISPPAFDTSNIKNITLPDERLRIALSGKIGKAIKPFEQIWPELPKRIAKNLEVVFKDSEAHKHHLQERYEIAYGRRHDEYPPTPTLQWNVELFISLLHDHLSELPAQLWKEGRWSEESENELLKHSLPNLKLHLAVAASRVIRPDYPLPSELKNGAGYQIILSDMLPEYGGWVRLGIYEKEYISDADGIRGKVVETATVFSGNVAFPLGGTTPLPDFPFQLGDTLSWWDKKFYSVRPITGFTGSVTGFSLVTDWLGDEFVLIPPAIIHDLIALSTPQYGEPLTWKDKESNPAVVMRTWRVRNTSGYSDNESVSLEGCDLIVRPDVASHLQNRSAGALHEVCIVNRT